MCNRTILAAQPRSTTSGDDYCRRHLVPTRREKKLFLSSLAVGQLNPFWSLQFLVPVVVSPIHVFIDCVLSVSTVFYPISKITRALAQRLTFYAGDALA